MKKLAFFLVAILVISFGASVLLKDKYVVPILMYHNVEPCTNPCPANTVSPEAFDRQMKYLKDNNFFISTVDAYVRQIIIEDGVVFKHPTVVITFDDAYDDNYEYAWPILKKHGIPAMIFVAPADIGTEGHVTWDQLHEMKGLVSYGSHSMTHAYLPDALPENLDKEIIESKKVLEEKLNQSIEYFAYPIGGFSDDIKARVKQAGYKAAFATNRGYDRFNKDVYELNRIRPKDDDSSIELWGKLSGFYNLIRKAKSPY